MESSVPEAWNRSGSRRRRVIILKLPYGYKSLYYNVNVNAIHNVWNCLFIFFFCGRHGGLMVSALDSGASAPGSSPGRGHCVVFLGKTLYSHGASLHPGV